MDWILILFALGFVAWAIGYQPKKSSAIITDDTPNTDTNDRDESQQKIVRDAIRNEIRAAIDRHVDAVCVLQMLARLDGNTAEAERNVIFDFLKRQGERLEPQHRAWFYSWAASEWQRTADNEEIGLSGFPCGIGSVRHRISALALVWDWSWKSLAMRFCWMGG
jgi:hypothetical protein